MFKIESYVTPILLSYVDKYVKDFRPADAQLSLWGGGLVLNNLVLKADVLQNEVSLPFTLVSGRIHELHIQVPWTKIMSEPIIVTIDTIECVLNLKPPVQTADTPLPESPSRKSQVVQAPPGYMQALVKRIVSNIVLRVEHLIVKYVEDDIVLSLNVKHLEISCADANWNAAFADIDPVLPVLRRLILLEDLTLCLDRADSDGKIRFYQEPLLYRCQLTLRVLSRLVSVNTRSPVSLSVQLRSSSLAWGVSSDQLALLVRVTRGRPPAEVKPPSPAAAPPPVQVPSVTTVISTSTLIEPARTESWAEWARSWVPNWRDAEGAAQEPELPRTPLPIEFTACCDSVALVLKLMESEPGCKKRARGVLELRARYLAVRANVCAPTTLQVCVGARELSLCAHGKCVCGHVDPYKSKDEPIEYIRKSGPADQEEWEWPEEAFLQTVDVDQAVDEEIVVPNADKAGIDLQAPQEPIRRESTTEQPAEPRADSESPTVAAPHEPIRRGPVVEKREANENDQLWVKMEPVVLLQYTHDRSPPQPNVDPYENPPGDFQYSDWVEVVRLKLFVEPMKIIVGIGLIHRVSAICNVFKELPIMRAPDSPKRVLTVEECEALSENTPQRRLEIHCRGLVVRLTPWEDNHAAPAYLDLQTNDAVVVVTSPLYPLRVCSAASQMPQDVGPLWQSAQLNVSATLSVQAKLSFPGDGVAPRPVARVSLQFVLHKLMHPEYFAERKSVLISYTAKIKEMNLCGSSPRLQVAWQVINSLTQQRTSVALMYTSLVQDAITDEESVAVDVTVEEVTLKGFRTLNVNTHIIQVQTVKATALHARAGEFSKQAWLFSGPDEPVTASAPGELRPYVRIAIQWCDERFENALDYIGVWAEATAVAVDPLFLAWLAYAPTAKPLVEPYSAPLTKTISSTQYFMRRRVTPPSSSGRGASRSGSCADMVHSVHSLRRSHTSSSEPERREAKPAPPAPKPQESIWEGEQLLQLHQRLRRLLLSFDLGLVLVYVTASSVKAVDHATIRDAMERHVVAQHRVMAVNLGRISAKCSGLNKLWDEVKNDGPTYFNKTLVVDEDSFPWKIKLSDTCLYTLDLRAAPERPAEQSGLRSRLKLPFVVTPNIILEMVTTTVTLSVVTKNMPVRSQQPRKDKRMFKMDPTTYKETVDEKKFEYFTSGIDFKPTTLKEFIRGPAEGRPKPEPKRPSKMEPQAPRPMTTYAPTGPVVLLGINLHADTPPLILRLDNEQVLMMGTSVHCLSHIMSLLRRPSAAAVAAAVAARRRSTLPSESPKPNIAVKSLSELDENRTASDETQTESLSDLVSIFKASSADLGRNKMNTFFWFQWVVSRATLVVTTPTVKLVFVIDDIISTVDLQDHYNQLKIKVASASVRHYERAANDEWKAGVLGGRVLEAREPSDDKEDSHFLAVTITQAQISNLPQGWKEELHPKILRSRSNCPSSDSMWEVYATLAPLEAVLQPVILKHVVMIAHEMAPPPFCAKDSGARPSPFQWPYMYINAGGLRLLVTGADAGKNESEFDDTFVIQIGKLDLNPHPDNPICRRALNVCADGGWLTMGGGFEGHQYETYVRSLSVHSAQFGQLASQEDHDMKMKGTSGENPAAKWAQDRVNPTLTPVLHSTELGCIVAPALYYGASLACGPAIELNILSDVVLEFSTAQITMCRDLGDQFASCLQTPSSSELELETVDYNMCPYENVLLRAPADTASVIAGSSAVPPARTEQPAPGVSTGLSAESGMDADAASSSKRVIDDLPKKFVSIATDDSAPHGEYLEVFVTMGTVELSLYALDDGSQSVEALKPPQLSRNVHKNKPAPATPPPQRRSRLPTNEEPELAGAASSHSLTETVRLADEGNIQLELPDEVAPAWRGEGMVPLIYATLLQPNLYYNRKKSQKIFQASLFNAWVGLGAGQLEGQWHETLMTTAGGVPDPLTDIPPALATIKLTTTTGAVSSRGSLRVDIERPVMFHMSEDRLRRLRGITALVKAMVKVKPDGFPESLPTEDNPALYSLRRSMLRSCVDCVTMQTAQVAVSGSLGVVGWEALSLQVCAVARPVQLTVRALVTAALVSVGSDELRQPLLMPCMIGVEVDAMWESWRLLEGGPSSRVPTVRLLVDFDRLTMELRPDEIAKLIAERGLLERMAGPGQPRSEAEPPADTSRYGKEASEPYPSPQPRHSISSIDPGDVLDHYYKDDLRSGVFKISSGGQLPMAYQVTLHEGVVSWRYPHPRAVTRIMAYPLPDQDTELDCVLEHYNVILSRWEPTFFFKLPVAEPREIKLHSSAPDVQYSATWRFRLCDATDETFPPPFQFDHKRFMPRPDPLLPNQSDSALPPDGPSASHVTAEMLSGALRVDSYFAPAHLPRVRAIVRVRMLQLHVNNALPAVPRDTSSLEGYYLSTPLRKRHRVLSLVARDSTAHAQLNPVAGTRLLLRTHIRLDLLDPAAATMDQLVEATRVQVAASFPMGALENMRVRFWTSVVGVALNVPRIRTLQALAADWAHALDLNHVKISEEKSKQYTSKSKADEEATSLLEGRVSLWIHNNCAEPLRVGQDTTIEVLTVGAGAWLAYRWRCPDAPKCIRFALLAPSTDFVWSACTPFTEGHCKVRLQEPDELTTSEVPSAAFLTVKVKDKGGRRVMHVSGRVRLANMLRINLLYKIRDKEGKSKNNAWPNTFSGELAAESLSCSVLASVDAEMVLKIRFANQDTGWSGDIPLNECPKENVPWLVKVPSEGEVPYVSVWCRVIRARSDGRLLATVWPLYVLRSHLPLDADVLIATQRAAESAGVAPPGQLPLPPLIQSAPGRGQSTHLLVPGTTSARHSLTFQYRNIECPVTLEAVPLHYGVTDKSVFDKRIAVNNIDDVIPEIEEWLDRTSRDAVSHWPYSVVAKHWPGEWKSALLQPRSDVAVNYGPVRVGGGCCLVMQLCPVVLLCNASPIALTLRAHDAAPLCKVESGTVIAPPNTILTKPFFMSTEYGREAYVSRQLEVWRAEPGPYGAPPPGHVGLDRRAQFAIHCNQKVVLLTLYYQIKHDINLLGVGPTYVLLNRLQKDILVSAVVVPEDDEQDVTVQPTHLTFITVPPIQEDSLHGFPLCRFALQGRWQGGDVSELRQFLYVSLAADAAECVPVRLATPPVRRAIALTDLRGNSFPVVVTQQEDEGRLLVTVAEDRCPKVVIENHTQAAMLVAQPENEDERDNTTNKPECPGAPWVCAVEAHATVYYSPPAHCERYPSAADPTARPSLPLLTLAARPEEQDAVPAWCAPVVLAAGIQLVQLAGGATVKVKIHPYPHSTLVELRNVDENDISASDIRRRLQGPFLSDALPEPTAESLTLLERVQAKDKLLRPVFTSHQDSIDDRSVLMNPDQLRDEEPHVVKQVKVLAPEQLDDGELTRPASVATLLDDHADKSVTGAGAGQSLQSALVRSSGSAGMLAGKKSLSQDESFFYNEFDDCKWKGRVMWGAVQRCRGVVGGVTLSVGAAADESPLVAVHATRLALILLHDQQGTTTTLTVADMQVDNLKYATGAYDFAVVAATRAGPQPEERWPALWGMFLEKDIFDARREQANAALSTRHDRWTVAKRSYYELTEVEVSLGPVALYIEDAYITALASLGRALRRPRPATPPALAAARALAAPLRLRSLILQPLVAHLTAHTNVRMYIALDQSPLHLGRYQLHDMMMSAEQLTHALTVHYLSDAVLGAGWVVGGLELLGAPGALAARVGGATGGVMGVASTAAAALLKSLSACAGSLARNLDLLAGDEEHARRAAAARRVPPPSLLAGLAAGVSNFAVNMLGAVGGLAHHPLVGVAVGETDSGAAALRRGLLGALAKPLSATADLVAYAGHGLLSQTGWDPVPQPRVSPESPLPRACWRRDAVRWSFRLGELRALAGFEVDLDGCPMHLLLTHKFLVLAEPNSERIGEMIDFKFCTLSPYNGPLIEISVYQPRRLTRSDHAKETEDDIQLSVTAMARVARYTGATTDEAPSTRRLVLLASPPLAPALHANLSALVHHNDAEHLHLM